MAAVLGRAGGRACAEHPGATDGSLLAPGWATLGPRGTWGDTAFLAQKPLLCGGLGFFETGFHVTQNGLKLGMMPRMT